MMAISTNTPTTFSFLSFSSHNSHNSTKDKTYKTNQPTNQPTYQLTNMTRSILVHPSAFKTMAPFPFSAGQFTHPVFNQSFRSILDDHPKQTRPAQMIDNETTVSLVLELPGVKHNNLTVETNDDTLKIHGVRTAIGSNNKTRPFEYIFALKPSRFDLANVTANLRDGILVVTIPKATTKNDNSAAASSSSSSLVLDVSRKDHDEWKKAFNDNSNSNNDTDGDSSKAKTITVEVPGVKSKDLQVDITNGIVSIVGTRKTGGVTSRIVRRYQLDTDDLTVSGAAANLSDGILVVSIPVREKEPSRVVVVTENEHEEVKDTKEDDGSNDDDDEMVVIDESDATTVKK